MNISEWVKGHAIFSPEKVALRTPDRTFTYRQLEAQIEATAYALKWELGVQPGERVAFLGYNCPEFLITLFACARIGALFVPLNTRLTVPEHLYILRDAGAKVLLLEDLFANVLTPVAEALPDCQIVGLDFVPQEGARWDALLSTTQDAVARDSHTPTVDLTSPLLIVYTSGTTGYPKGAVHTQEGVQWNAINNLHLNDLTSADHILTVLPLFHVGGFNVQTLPAFYCGATVTLHPHFDPEQTLSAISIDRPTLTHLVPSMMRACIQSDLWNDTDFTNLRMLLTGTTIIPQALCDAFRSKGVEVAELYGATETCPIAIYKRPDYPRDKSTSIGRPALHCMVRVVDEDGNDQPAGEAGEILIKGPNVMLGYWKNEAATTQALRNGWYHTGDMGYCDEDGYYFIHDRKKNVIIKGGENIYPAEVERVLNTHPDIQESAVVGIPNPKWQEIPLALLVATTDIETPSVRQIRSFLTDKLAAYKIPHKFIFTDALPKNAMGKLQHFRARETVMQDEKLMAQFSRNTAEIQQLAPESPKVDRNALPTPKSTQSDTPSEIPLRGIGLATDEHADESCFPSVQEKVSQDQSASGKWIAQLQLASPSGRRKRLERYIQDIVMQLLADSDANQEQPIRLSLQQGFFEMGMDSLMTIQLRKQLEAGLGYILPVTLLFKYSSIETLTTYLLNEVLPTAKTTLAVEQLKHSTHEQLGNEPIAIVGMGCRFPGGANDPSAYWQLLADGVDAISEVPAERWEIDAYYDPSPDMPGKMYTRSSGFLDKGLVDHFDAQFFGISPREAVDLDPQHRLLLEVSWEALERAGLAPSKLRKTKTGVFIGLSFDDYAQLGVSSGDPTQIRPYASLGNYRSVAAGRIAYVLGLQGPTMQVDTACSSSLLAIHLAVMSLRAGESNLALAGGVNLMLSPSATIGLCKLKALAPDGRCKTFDAAADGYARGEGAGMIVLKRLSDAQADGDPILALIRGSAINHDGPSSGLTVPNQEAQENVIRQALENGKVKAHEVSYVEAHGTGTFLGDPIEVDALATVYGTQRQQPLMIGSVKTNIGHLESAAGIAGVMKVVLALQHQQIPPHLHFTEPNPNMAWDTIPVTVPTEATAWQPSGKRLAGISSFGMSGTNAHVVLEAAPAAPVIEPSYLDLDVSTHLLALSAKTDAALSDLITAYATHLIANPDLSLADICFTANTGRSHFEHRVALVAQSTAELSKKLLDAARQAQERRGQAALDAESGTEKRIAFLFSGQGSQYVQMGRELYETQPTFRQALERCDEIWRDMSFLDHSLLSILYPSDDLTEEAIKLLNNTAYTQPALFALEYALYELWTSWGIEPDIVMGHSVGEYVAACVAGVFSLEDGLMLISERGRLMQSLPDGGEMVAVMASEAVCAALIGTHYAQEVSLAAINGPESVVISGKSEAIEAIVEQLTARDIKTRKLSVSHAFHSPLMEPMLPAFEQVANSINYASPQIDFISNVTGDVASDEIATAEYWVRHVRQSVRFADGMNTLDRLALDTADRLETIRMFVEIGPQPTLLGMGRRCLPESTAHWLPSLRKGGALSLPKGRDWPQILTSLGELYRQGVEVDWTGFNRDYVRSRVVLPTYAWQKERYWIEPRTEQAAPISPTALTFNNSNSKGTPALLGQRLRLPFSKEIRFESIFSASLPAYLDHHRLYNTIVVAAASHLSMVLSGVREAFGEDSCQVEDAYFLQALTIDEENTRAVQLVLSPSEEADKSSFQLISLRDGQDENDPNSWLLHATGSVRRDSFYAPEVRLDEISARCTDFLAAEAFYDGFWEAGYHLGSSFRWMDALWLGDGEALCRLKQPALPDDVSAYQLYPGLIDSYLQVLSVHEVEHLLQQDFIYVPFTIGSFTLHARPTPGSPLWCHAEVREREETRLMGDIRLFEESGRVIAEVRGLEVRKAPRTALLGSSQTDIENSLYEVTWQPKPLMEGSTHASGSWLIFADKQGVAQKLAEQLSAQGEHSVLLDADDPAINLARQPLTLSNWNGKEPYQGIVYLSSLDESASEDAPLEYCAHLLHIVQGAVNSPSSPQIWVATNGAQPVDGTVAHVGIQQAPLWGLGRVIALEHPNLHHIIDVDPTSQPAEVAEQLARELRSSASENQVAYRQGSRYVPRLTAPTRQLIDPAPLNGTLPSVLIRADSSYLITGGLGSLGLKVASWLAQQGARHLVLAGRRGASEAAQKVLNELEGVGVKITIFKADVSNQEDVKGLFAAAPSPLRGIVHAAGVLDDGILLQQTAERFKRVMAPKVQGAWTLHKQSVRQNLPLDFFVLFSSAASLIGSAGQGNYAAGNAFMDALAHHRAGLGLPALSINWGAWGETGMAARLEARFGAQGLKMIAPEQALQLLGKLLKEDVTQIGALPIDWSQFLAQVSAKAFFEVVAPAKAEDSSTQGFRQQLNNTPVDEQAERLITHIRATVGEVLGLMPSIIKPRQRLFDLGLDSLMAVELKNRLESSLSHSLRSTLLFDYPTVEALGTYLTEEILETSPANAPAAEDTLEVEALSELDMFDEDEMDALIASELEDLEMLLGGI